MFGSENLVCPRSKITRIVAALFHSVTSVKSLVTRTPLPSLVHGVALPSLRARALTASLTCLFCFSIYYSGLRFECGTKNLLCVADAQGGVTRVLVISSYSFPSSGLLEGGEFGVDDLSVADPTPVISRREV